MLKVPPPVNTHNTTLASIGCDVCVYDTHPPDVHITTHVMGSSYIWYGQNNEPLNMALKSQTGRTGSSVRGHRNA